MTLENKVNFLAKVPLCAGLSAVQLSRLAELLKPQYLAIGDVLFREGDPGDAFYVIQVGQIGVFKEVPTIGRQRLSVLEAGDPIGLVCLIDPGARSATCIAIDASLILRADRSLFERLFNRSDAVAERFIEAISRDLCQRLRNNNRKLYSFYANPEATLQQLNQARARISQRLEQDSREIRVLKPGPREQPSWRRILG